MLSAGLFLVCDWVRVLAPTSQSAILRRAPGTRCGVSDGTRTRDHRHHKPGLYQLSYAHRDLRAAPAARGPGGVYRLSARGRTTPVVYRVATSIAALSTCSLVGPGAATKAVAR